MEVSTRPDALTAAMPSSGDSTAVSSSISTAATRWPCCPDRVYGRCRCVPGNGRGWTCPRCGRVWSPSFPGPCVCHGQVVPCPPGCGERPWVRWTTTTPPRPCEHPRAKRRYTGRGQLCESCGQVVTAPPG